MVEIRYEYSHPDGGFYMEITKDQISYGIELSAGAASKNYSLKYMLIKRII